MCPWMQFQVEDFYMNMGYRKVRVGGKSDQKLQKTYNFHLKMIIFVLKVFKRGNEDLFRLGWQGTEQEAQLE